MATRWIDFRALKQQVSIRDVLERYGVLKDLKANGPKLVGPCPVHGGKNGTSFNADVERGIWNCFSDCKRDGKSGGNVLDLVMRMEGCTIREAGEKLCDWFGLEFTRDGDSGNSAKVSEKKRAVTAATHPESDDTVNPPLERPLSKLKADHAYIAGRKITKQTAEHLGIGYCTRGLMRGRIAIPIHDEGSQLVAYAGRAVADELAEEKGKYRLPNGFKKSHVVWNLHRAGDAEQLIVVEGFFGAMRVHQAGFENVVALMGSTLSDQQELLLLAHSDHLVLLFDGDDAGRECERDFYRRLRTKLFMKSVHLANNEQPDDLSDDTLRELLS